MIEAGERVLCRQCFEAQSMAGLLVCCRCWDKNQYHPETEREEGRAVRQGEARKARLEEECFTGNTEVAGGTVGRTQGESKA